MRRLFRLKYPKTFFLCLCIILSYLFFSQPLGKNFLFSLGLDGYLGAFIAGLFFSFGFTTPFAIGAFIILSPKNILLASIAGSLGSVISNLILFGIIKNSFADEFNKFMKSIPVKKLNHLTLTIGKRTKHYLLYAFAGLVIASPLPDEVGVTMLTGLSHIKAFPLAVISFFCHFIGIFIFLSI